MVNSLDYTFVGIREIGPISRATLFLFQVLVDGKNFQTAIDDYNAAQRLSEQGVNKVQVRKIRVQFKFNPIEISNYPSSHALFLGSALQLALVLCVIFHIYVYFTCSSDDVLHAPHDLDMFEKYSTADSDSLIPLLLRGRGCAAL